CQFFLKGTCRFGQRCRLSHSDPSGESSGPVALNQDDKEEQMKSNKSEKTKHEATDLFFFYFPTQMGTKSLVCGRLTTSSLGSCGTLWWIPQNLLWVMWIASLVCWSGPSMTSRGTPTPATATTPPSWPCPDTGSSISPTEGTASGTATPELTGCLAPPAKLWLPPLEGWRKANTPAILSGFQQLQEELTTLLPASAPNWSSSSSLHVTLCLLVLPGPAEVAAAGEMLRRFAQLDRNPPVVLTFPLRLKHFNGRVLYLSPHPQLHLQQLNGGLQEAFRREGWLHRHSNNPRYHLTLAKSPGEEEDRVFERVGDLKVGKGLNFGRLPVNTLHLCSMGLSGVDGFYQTLCTVTLR
ncbi:unnamed protein product, partial [Tetraodon nigroviridis]